MSEKKKQHTFKNWPIIKNPQFLSYPHEIWWKWLPHEVIIFTKFHEDRTKIVDFLLMANFWKCPFFASDFKKFFSAKCRLCNFYSFWLQKVEVCIKKSLHMVYLKHGIFYHEDHLKSRLGLLKLTMQFWSLNLKVISTTG